MGRGDLLVAFARDDETTADAIQRGAIRRILMLESREVSVRVADGVVMPLGQIPNRSDQYCSSNSRAGSKGSSDARVIWSGRSTTSQRVEH